MHCSPLRTRWVALAASFAAFTAAPAARAHDWDLQGKIGVGVPFGNLGDAYDPGLAVGLGLSHWFTPRVALHLGGAGEFLGGSEPAIPDVTLWHYDVGTEIDLIDPATSKVRLHLRGGLGATTAQTDGGGSDTNFTLNTGLSVEYPLNENWRILGGPDLYVILADETQTVLPISVGFRYIFSEP